MKPLERALDELDQIAEEHALSHKAVSDITKLLHDFRSQLLNKKG